MPTFEVINKRTRTVLGRLTVDNPEKVLDALADQSGATVEEIATSLGKTVEEARAALDIREVEDEGERRDAKRKKAPAVVRSSLPPRRLFA